MAKAAQGSSAVDQLLRAVEGPAAGVAIAAARRIRALGPTLKESVRWGAPNWSGRAHIFCLMIYDDHVNIGLWRGAELADRFPLVEGTGKALRHVKLRRPADADRPEVRELLKAALALDASGSGGKSPR